MKMETINEEVSIKDISIDWKGRAMRAEERLEKMELLALYAIDVCRAWPTMSLKTVPKMDETIRTLKKTIESIQL